MCLSSGMQLSKMASLDHKVVDTFRKQAASISNYQMRRPRQKSDYIIKYFTI